MPRYHRAVSFIWHIPSNGIYYKLLPCTIIMNNMESKKERARENQDTDLRDSAMPTSIGVRIYFSISFKVTT
jgi:hypothetical protein